MITFKRVEELEGPRELYMDDGKYVWRDWWPRTERQCQVANAAYAYLIAKEPHVSRIVVTWVGYSAKTQMWRITHLLDFTARPEPVYDALFLSAAAVDEILAENER